MFIVGGKKMNKKADVPVMVLVIGVVAICSLAIFSFIAAKKIIEENSLENGLYLFEQVYSDLEKFYFYSNEEIGFSESDSAKMIGAEIIDGNLIIKKGAGGIEIRYEKKLG
jgi:hypothetical protein